MFVYEFLKLKIDLCEVFSFNDDRAKTSQYKSFIQLLYTNKLVVRDFFYHNYLFFFFILNTLSFSE